MWHHVILAAILATAAARDLPELPNVFSGDTQTLSVISEQFANRISEEYIEYLKTGIESSDLSKLRSQFKFSHQQKYSFTKSIPDLDAGTQFGLCTMCRAALNVLGNTLTGPNGELTGPNRDALTKKVVLDGCRKFNLQTEEVCGGLFDLNWPYLDYIINNTAADSRSICGMLPIKMCQINQPEFNFTLKIDNNGPKLNGSKTDLPERSDAELSILQLTDIHYDPEYKVNSLANCPEPLCCRKAPSEAVNAAELAGYWSDYRSCDTPKHLIVNALDHIKATHKPDFIYHTGDVPPHNVWSTTKEGNINMLTEIHNLLVEKFPTTPVYPCLGNHEPNPTNIFGNDEIPEKLRVTWLYEHLWSLWSRWLPNSTRSTILKGGYYTVVPLAGHRIISLNSMDCYILNWWVYYNGSIVLDQLNWLHDILLAAERDGEYVHILSHIPSGSSDCWPTWAREYNRILARFSHIITGIFNGHTHNDEMIVHYTSENYAVAVSWNAGSLTTYFNKNPNYRIYDVDPKTWQILDHHTWIFNLTEANKRDGTPAWFEEYQFTKTYTTDTSPAGIDNLLLQMAQQPSLLRKYWRHLVTNADPALKLGCNDDCLLSHICHIARSTYDNTQRCKELQKILARSLENEIETTVSPDTGGGANYIKSWGLTMFVGIFYFRAYFA